MKTAQLRFKKQTSDVQDRIESHPDLFQEFRYLERALCGCRDNVAIDPVYAKDAEKRLDYLDDFFGFRQESQFRKSGIESSHWEGRKAYA